MTVLRDTGSTGVVVKKQFVRPEEMAGDTRRCVLIDKTALLPCGEHIQPHPYFNGSIESTGMKDAVCDLTFGNIPSSQPLKLQSVSLQHPPESERVVMEES